MGPGVVLGVPAPDPDPEAPPDAEPDALPLPLMPPLLDPLGLLELEELPELAGGVEGLVLLLELLEPGPEGLVEGEDFDDEPDDDPLWLGPRSQAASASAAATAAARLRNFAFNMGSLLGYPDGKDIVLRQLFQPCAVRLRRPTTTGTRNTPATGHPPPATGHRPPATRP